MKKGLWQLRIPTFAALLVLFASVWVTTLLIQSRTSLTGSAGPDKEPRNIEFSNISSSTFSVVFTTKVKTISAISVDDGKSAPYVVYDDRDKITGEKRSYYSHLISVNNLQPQTKYNIKILSDGEAYPIDGSTFTVTTGPLLGKSTINGSIKGNVLLPDGNTASDTLIVLKTPNAQLLSTITDQAGNFTIPLTNIRTADLKNYFKFQSQNSTLSINHANLVSSVNVVLSTTLNIPTITLSYSYDFTQIAKIEEATDSSSLLNSNQEQITTGQVKITNPKPNDSFVDTRPLFQGTALPNTNVQITIESEPIQTIIKSNSKGLWSFRPPSPLAPGKHKITIQTVDGAGLTRTLSVNFSVFAEGSQIADSGPTVTPTPRASTTPTKTPTATPTPTAKPSPTISVSTPTPSLIPNTPTPTIAPTATLIPTQTIIPTATTIPTKPPTITPVPTGNTSTILLSTFSLILISVGLAIFFLL